MSKDLRHDPIQGVIIHEYDGIEEADNRLPQWWLWTFYLAIAFSFFYWLYYEGTGIGPGPLDRYAADRAAAMDTGAPITEEVLLGLRADKLAVRSGEKAFAQNCAKCHGSRAEGNIGPNLTDEYWIGDDSPMGIYTTIREGRDGKGMPAWGLQLGPATCSQLAAYVLRLRDTHVPGKAPQGERRSAAKGATAKAGGAAPAAAN